MDANFNASVPQAVTSNGSAAPKTGKRRPGKASRARKSDEFRIKMNSRQYEARRKEREDYFLVGDELAAVEEGLKSMRLTLQPRAIPMTVATRGVGFASAIEYSRMITTWNVEAIEAICTIHQYFRVNMFLLYYKLYLANREQGEMLSFPLEGVLLMSEELRQIIAPITQVPIAMSNVLHAVGKIEGETTFHARMFFEPPQSGEQMAIYLNPTVMRDTVEYLSNPLNSIEERNRFHALNPIPGAIWVNTEADGWILQNPDQIWPLGYGAQQLSADVHAYQNLLTRAGGRLPRSFLVRNTWSGKGS